MSVVHAVEIVDKNGKRNTVRKKVEQTRSSTARAVGVSPSNHRVETFDHPLFPDAEDKKTAKLIKQIFKGAVEFRFEFEVEGGSLYIMNRAVILDDGGSCSDEENTPSDVLLLDSVSDRIADLYYTLGAFGSDKRVRVVNQESHNRYVAIRLD